MNRIEILTNSFLKAGIEIDERQAEQFLYFYEMLIEKNKDINLTAITEFDDVLRKHFIDSLMLYRVFIPKPGMKGIDVGTGAGFPGIPIKLVYSKTNLTLVDSLNKRVKFLNEIIENLQLKNIYTVHSRVEDLSRKQEFREKFDFCVSRAVANLSVLSEYCLPFVKTGGTFIAYKSEKTQSEIHDAENAIKILGGKIEKVEEFTLFDTDYRRSLILIRKERKTPEKYPRKAGTPSKAPL